MEYGIHMNPATVTVSWRQKNILKPRYRDTGVAVQHYSTVHLDPKSAVNIDTKYLECLFCHGAFRIPKTLYCGSLAS